MGGIYKIKNNYGQSIIIEEKVTQEQFIPIWAKGTINTITGKNESSSIRIRSGYIDVKKGAIVKTSFSKDRGGICPIFYKDNKGQIDTSFTSNNKFQIEYKVQPNKYNYMRLIMQVAGDDEENLKEAISVEDGNANCVITLGTKQVWKPLKNKTIIFIGDSIPRGQLTNYDKGVSVNYPDIVELHTKARVLNYGIGGSTLACQSDYGGVFKDENAFNTAQKDISKKYDYYIHMDEQVSMKYNTSTRKWITLVDFSKPIRTEIDSVLIPDKTKKEEERKEKVKELDEAKKAKDKDKTETLTNEFNAIESELKEKQKEIAEKQQLIRETRDPICKRIKNLPKGDYIVIAAGTNDFQYNWTALGNNISKKDTQFYGALNNICDYLINNAGYDKNHIFFCTPIRRGQNPYYFGDDKNENGKTLKEYGEIIMEVCKNKGVNYIDLYTESGLNPVRQLDLFDGLRTHPFQVGHDRIGLLIAEKIEQSLSLI